MLSFFPRGVLDGILNLIESVSEGFPSYSCTLKACYDEMLFYTSDAIRIESVIDVIHRAISSCFFIKCNVHMY